MRSIEIAGAQKAISLVAAIFAAMLFMYQETPAEEGQPANGPQSVAVSQTAPTIAYTVSMEKPWTHLLEVEMRLSWPTAPDRTQLKMAVWTPGSYLIREYARHVQDFAVQDASGKKLEWEKINKNTWDINSKGSREVVVSYRVYSNELTVRTNELNDEHAFWNNGALLMFPAGHLNAPSTIDVKPFGPWKVATGLAPIAGAVNRFQSPNFDVLFDSPFEVSNFTETTFTFQGKPHRIVITGEGNYDLNALRRDVPKIFEEGFKIFGDVPYDNYLIIVNLRGGGGLEHLNSTALQWNRWGFKPPARYRAFLGLVAHEVFHLWNVKRIKPDALGPFDYENENYTKLLWVAEGATSYYEGILLRRAGLTSDDEILNTKSGMITSLQARPGRFQTSLEEASMDAWIKYYRQDENSVNNQISYYDKGEIVHMMLDVTIRTASNGAKSLDNVMRHLYDEFYRKGRNFTPEDYQRVSEMMAGRSLDDFFSKYVRGREDIDYAGIMSGMGIRVLMSHPGTDYAYLGAELNEDGGRLTIRTLYAGTPAYEQGLNTGDQIVAIDGYRASNQFLMSYLLSKKPGDKIKLSLFRFDKLREMEITLGANQRVEYAMAPVDSPTEDQRRLYRDYLKSEL